MNAQTVTDVIQSLSIVLLGIGAILHSRGAKK